MKTIDLNQRQGYPMGSRFKKITETQIEIEYRDTQAPDIDDTILLWVDIPAMGGRSFKIIAIQELGEARQKGVKIYLVIARTINPFGAQ